MNKYIVEFKHNLGDRVKCIHSGFTGVVVGRIQYFNKCVQYAVMPKCGKDNKPEELFIDEQSLKLIKSAIVKKEKPKEFNGGPNRKKIERGF